MKLALAAFAALLFAAPAAAPVRYEAQGIRVGGELVSGPALQLKGVDATTLLVSASSVENLGAPVDVALDASHAIQLQPGLRLERKAEGFLLGSHGPALAVEAAGLTLNGATSVAFTLTPKGFDFGPLGSIEGPSFTARVAQDPITSPERRTAQMRGSRAASKHRVYRGNNPLVPTAGADREVLATLAQVSGIGN